MILLVDGLDLYRKGGFDIEFWFFCKNVFKLVCLRIVKNRELEIVREGKVSFFKEFFGWEVWGLLFVC